MRWSLNDNYDVRLNYDIKSHNLDIKSQNYKIFSYDFYFISNNEMTFKWKLRKSHIYQIKSQNYKLLNHNYDIKVRFIKSNQIKSLLLSHHHSTSALVSEILMSVLQTVQKKQQTIYIWTDSAKKTTDSLHMDRQCKKTALEHLQCSRQCKKHNNSNLHMDRQCKKATAIYIWTVHIYRLYRRQCAKYTYIYSVHIVYYKDILNYQRHIIHRMGTSALCTVSIHNVVYA